MSILAAPRNETERGTRKQTPHLCLYACVCVCVYAYVIRHTLAYADTTSDHVSPSLRLAARMRLADGIGLLRFPFFPFYFYCLRQIFANVRRSTRLSTLPGN